MDNRVILWLILVMALSLLVVTQLVLSGYYTGTSDDYLRGSLRHVALVAPLQSQSHNVTALVSEIESLRAQVTALKRDKEQLQRTAQQAATGARPLASPPSSSVASGVAPASSSMTSTSTCKSLQSQTEPFFCPPQRGSWKEDRDAWLQRKLTFSYVPGAGEHRTMISDAKDLDLSRQPQWMCDKLRNSLAPWVEPIRYTVDDIVVGIFTGENIFYSRAAAVRDTWLARLPHKYLFAGSGDSNLPVVGLEDIYPNQIKPGDVQATQLLGLKYMVARHPNAKWFGIWGCDTYINIDYALRSLEPYDWREDVWLTPATWPHGPGMEGVNNIDTSQWPKWKMGKANNTFYWSSGAFGWYFSRSVAQAYADNIDKLMADKRFPKNCNCPDVVTGLLLSLLGFEPTHFSLEVGMGMLAYAPDCKTCRPDAVNEYILYHYAQPRRMMGIDQRVQHEKLDRLINAGDPAAVVRFFRQFIDEHFDTLRRKQTDVRYLYETCSCGKKMLVNGERPAWFDVPLYPYNTTYFAYEKRTRHGPYPAELARLREEAIKRGALRREQLAK